MVGKQWMWKVQHPEGQREINELHVPVGQPVKLTLTSEDVIHEFLRARLPHQAWTCCPGRYTSDLVPGDEDRAGTTCSARSTAARTSRHDR